MLLRCLFVPNIDKEMQRSAPDITLSGNVKKYINIWYNCR